MEKPYGPSPLLARLFSRIFRRRALLVPLCLLIAAPALAGSVFLNGVNIDGVTGQRFENVTVVIDENGNILITAKGYEVQTTTTPKKPAQPAAESGPVTRRYFLVSETNFPGMVQYEIDVFVNAVWVKRISHEDPQTVMEITRHFKKGKNTIHFTATKAMGDARRSTSPAHYLKVIVGEGNMGGNNVMIDNALIEYKRTAAEMKNFSDDFQIVGR